MPTTPSKWRVYHFTTPALFLGTAKIATIFEIPKFLINFFRPVIYRPLTNVAREGEPSKDRQQASISSAPLKTLMFRSPNI